MNYLWVLYNVVAMLVGFWLDWSVGALVLNGVFAVLALQFEMIDVLRRAGHR